MDNWIATSDSEIMGGELCFTGTRVPVETLFAYIRAGRSLDVFLEGFPTVSREQVNGMLDESLAHARELQSA